MSLWSAAVRGATLPPSFMIAVHFASTISEAPLVKTRNPPPGSGRTVDMLLRAELKVYTFVKTSMG